MTPVTAPDREAEIRKNIQRGTYEVAGDADVVGLIGEIDRLRDTLDEAEKALHFYANPENWSIHDSGQIARAALAWIGAG